MEQISLNVPDFDNSTGAKLPTAELPVSKREDDVVEFTVFKVESEDSLKQIVEEFYKTLERDFSTTSNYPEWALGLDEDVFIKTQMFASESAKYKDIVEEQPLTNWQETLISYGMFQQYHLYGDQSWSRALSTYDYWRLMVDGFRSRKSMFPNCIGFLPFCLDVETACELLGITDFVGESSIILVVPNMMSIFHI